LFEHGCEFDFFQAVRLLGRVYPRRREVGTTAKPSEEFARFRAHLTMAFPASAIHEVTRDEDSANPVHLTVAFMGLTGTQGVLPFWYTEHLMARNAARDDTTAAFFDIFHHRLLSLFYRAWKKHRPAVLYESSATRQAIPDTFTQNLFDLIGMGTAGLRGRLHVCDESLLLYSGLIAQKPHSAAALVGILRDFFHVDVEVDQCLGDWYQVDDSERCCLLDTENDRLGTAAFVGGEVWDQQARFRLRLGPLTLDRFVDFLPDGLAMGRLVDLTRYFVGQALSFDVQLVLDRGAVPWCRLGDEGPNAPRLGWMGWLKTGDFDADAGDAVFRWVN
jgi:type VI secretion system protein ImpH